MHRNVTIVYIFGRIPDKDWEEMPVVILTNSYTNQTVSRKTNKLSGLR